MSSAHFEPRGQIIEWINDLLITNVSKIQQLGSGNIYCQILDAAYPEKVQLQKVKWNAYLEVDFLHNYKILQNAFERLGIRKCFDAQKLAKAKYQDNWEFIQWMKHQFSAKIKENMPYNALARRNQAKINLLFIDQKHFDLKQTLAKEHKDNKENKENNEKREVKGGVKMISSVTGNSRQPSLSTTRSVLGLKSLNFNSQQLTKSLKKNQFTKKLNSDKQNLSKCQSSLKLSISKPKKQGLYVTVKPKMPKQITFNAVEMIQSDEQQCF